MLSEPHQVVDRDVEFLMRVVRMRTDRAEDVLETLGDRPDLIEFSDPRANGHHRPDAG